jgi:hypothetical protein
MQFTVRANVTRPTLTDMNLESHRERRIDEMEEFKTFSNEIDYLIKFFKNFSILISCSGRIITFFTNEQNFLFDTTLIVSSSQTLRSIKQCCSIGSFSDANTLIRKLRDDLIQYVYILTIINERNHRIHDSMTDDEKAVSAWFSNSVSELEYSIIHKLEFENYMTTLKQNPKIKDILERYNLLNYWGKLRKRLNNYVHNNGENFSMHNSIETYDPNLKVHLKNINITTDYVSSFFIIVLLMVYSALISSGDYVDYMDFGLEPPKDCQYNVAKFVQDFIDLKINKLHPELKNYLKDNNIHGMKIE